MRDGVALATDVHGVADGPRPVLLIRTPYGKAVAGQLGAPFVAAGYVVVAQDCRGCFGSEGEIDFLWPEAEDGYDTCAWIVDQTWCNGKIGTFGSSWSGWTQTALAALDPPGLAAMVPMQSGARALQTSVRHHGTVELRFIAWAYWHAAQNTRMPAELRKQLSGGPVASELFRQLPLRAGASGLPEAYERWVLEIASSGDDSERWRHPSVDYLTHASSAAAVPTLLVGGWYDSYTRAELQLFLAMRKRGAPVHLLLGPWTHGSLTLEQSLAGDIDLGPEAALPSYHQLHLDFFDQHLRGAEPVERAPLRLFVMGGGAGTRTVDGRRLHGGRWRNEQDWPLARTEWTTLHLHGDGGLRPERASGSTSYDCDPSHPVPTVGGNLSSLMDLQPAALDDELQYVDPARMRDMVPAGGWDQRDVTGRPLADREDVLVFQTDPLVDPMEITGPVTVVLWVSTEAADTDVTAKLVDMYPDGYAMNLTDSIVRLRYRQGESAIPYASGDVVRVDVKLYPTSNVFEVGHRVRLDISGSSFPRFDPNPGTGEPLWGEQRRVVQRNTLWHDTHHPSRVLLPVIPAPPLEGGLDA